MREKHEGDLFLNLFLFSYWSKFSPKLGIRKSGLYIQKVLLLQCFRLNFLSFLFQLIFLFLTPLEAQGAVSIGKNKKSQIND